jgi:hypothetical protein
MYGTPVLMRLATRNTTKTDSYQLLDMSHCWRYGTCFQVFYSLIALAFRSNSFNIKSFTQIIMIWTLLWAIGLTLFSCYMNFLSEILILVTVLYNKYHLLQPNEEYHDTVENDSKLCYFWCVSMPLIWRELIKRTILALLLWHMVSKMSLFFKTYACNELAEGCIF